MQGNKWNILKRLLLVGLLVRFGMSRAMAFTVVLGQKSFEDDNDQSYRSYCSPSKETYQDKMVRYFFKALFLCKPLQNFMLKTLNVHQRLHHKYHHRLIKN